MKKILSCITQLAFVSSLFYSCQKVIDVDLNSADPKIVIEANLSDQAASCVVKLTKTVNFDKDNNFPTVSGATVTITDNLGNSTTLSETSPGLYTSSYVGVPGRVYSLSVTAEGKTYTAVSSMPAAVALDTVYIAERDIFFGGPDESNKEVKAEYKDPAGVTNYYKFNFVHNNKLSTDIYLDSDRLEDGKTMTRNLRGGDDDILTGDTIVIFIQTIDQGVYDYFSTLSQLSSGGIATSAPANPRTNITGEALGYFSAHAERYKGVKVQ